MCRRAGESASATFSPDSQGRFVGFVSIAMKPLPRWTMQGHNAKPLGREATDPQCGRRFSGARSALIFVGASGSEPPRPPLGYGSARASRVGIGGSAMSVRARRVAAVFGGVLFGFAVGASIPTFATVNNEGSIGLGGLAGGLGLGLMVAALVRE